MNLAKNKRILAFFLVFASLFVAIGNGFSDWWFPNQGDDSKNPIADVEKMDEIAENYRFLNKTYTFVFFPQPVNPDNPPTYTELPDGTVDINYQARQDPRYGRWANGAGAENPNSSIYGYKKITFVGTVNLDDISKLGTLTIQRSDIKNNYPYSFLGWTANAKESKIYASKDGSKPEYVSKYNNNYDFIDFTKEPYQYDTADNDNSGTSYPNNHYIFLYPYYGTGKNSDSPDDRVSYYHPVIRLQKGKSYVNGQNVVPNEPHYFEEKVNADTTYNPTLGLGFSEHYYSLTGFRTSGNPDDKYQLMFNLPARYGWEKPWRTLDWSKPQIGNNQTTEASPLPQEGNSISEEIWNETNGWFITGESDPDIDNPQGPVDQQQTRKHATPTFLKGGKATYNIYIYMKYIGNKTYPQEGYASATPPGNANAWLTVNPYFNNTLDPSKNTFIKTARYIRKFDNQNWTGSTLYKRPLIDGYTNLTLLFFIKVEKIEDLKLATAMNSNNFTNPELGTRLYAFDLPTGNKVTNTTVNGTPVKAIDYYALNVPVIRDQIQYPLPDPDKKNRNIWYKTNYYALALENRPIISTRGFIEIDFKQNASEADVGQINKRITDLLNRPVDYVNLPGVSPAQNTPADNDRYIQFNPAPGANYTKSLIGNNQDASSDFRSAYDFSLFFSFDFNNASGIYSDYKLDEFNLAVRLYYKETTNNDGVYNNDVFYYSVVAMPVKIRKTNSFYFINEKDADKIVRLDGKGEKDGLLDLDATIDALNKSNSTYYQAPPQARTVNVSKNDINFDTMSLIEWTGGNKKEGIQFRTVMTSAYDISDKAKTPYTKDSYPAFDRARIFFFK